MSEFKYVLNKRTGQFNLVPTNIVLSFKAAVATQASLPLTGNVKGDARLANDTGHLYTWSIDASSGLLTDWTDAGDIVDLTWDAISGKPTSTPANIDTMVTTGTPRLMANTTYYVNCDTGNDSNSGAIGSPFATIQKAVNMFPKNLGGLTATIKLFPSLNYTGNISITNFYGGNFGIYRETSLGDSDVLITGSLPISISNFKGYLNIDGSAHPPSSKKIILKTNVNYGTCLLIVDSSRILLNAIGLADNGNTGTKGIDSRFSVVDINTITDYDSNKVATGIRNYGGSIVWVENPALSFGDTFLSPSNSGITIKGTGNYIIDSNFDLAVTRQHVQGTDQGLDTGGANAVTVSDVKDAVTKKHTQNTDISIGTPSALVLDQNYPGTENSADPFAGDYVLAQPFVAGLSGELQKITLKLYKLGTPSGNFTVELRNTELDGTPGTNVLATCSKTSAEISTTPTVVDFIFSVPYSVVATTRYAIVTYGGLGQTGENYYAVVDENPGTFDIGFYYATGSQPWTWAIQNTTMYFKTYVYQSGSVLDVSSTTENFDIAGEISVKVYSQATEPTLGANNRIAIWIDTDDNFRVYLLFKRPSMSGYDDQVAVELA